MCRLIVHKHKQAVENAFKEKRFTLSSKPTFSFETKAVFGGQIELRSLKADWE